MLDLDAGIEADLGIDSIKRVEILTALQKLGTPAEQQSVQGIMNKLTSARTLREIADLLAGCCRCERSRAARACAGIGARCPNRIRQSRLSRRTGQNRQRTHRL